MSCDNCSSGVAQKPAYFSDHTEHWCLDCYAEFYEGKNFNPHKKLCDLCPEGNAIHTVISHWRDKVFEVCSDCHKDLAVETETRRQKILAKELDNSSEV